MLHLSTQDVVSSIEKSTLLVKQGISYQHYQDFFGNDVLKDLESVENLKTTELERQIGFGRANIYHSEIIMKKMKIFTVGGTIDKIYFDAQSEYEVGSPTIEKMLERFNVYFDYSITSLFQKDSLEMTDEDRSKIFQAVAECSEENILITHGTDTMDQTARALSDIPGKTIVLTGSLLPANFRESDAEFNIGSALGAMWSADPGVYIAMNGFIFSWRDVYKDRIEMQFRQRLNQ